MSKIKKLFKSELKIINMGLESFHKDLKDQEVSSVHMNWRPRAGGNQKMKSLLDRLEHRRR